MNVRRTAGSLAIGIDVGGTNVRAARVDRDGQMSDHSKHPVDSMPSVSALIGELCTELLTDDVAAIAIGIPGRLSADGAILSTGFLPLAGIPLKDEIEAATSRPVILENDGHMALVAELEIGAAVGARDVVLFTAGTGIGGAVASEARIVRGQANAGQLGHLALDPRGPHCNCGRRGCSEVLASGTALTRLIGEAGMPESMTIEMLFDRASRGDEPAADVLRSWAGAWRSAIDTVVATLDPELVVIGGGLGASAVRAVERFAPARSDWFDRRVVQARFGDDAGVIGAGLRALAG